MAEDNTYPHRMERRQAETELEHSFFREREARRELSGILESVSDAFFAVDHEWRFTYVNGRAEQFWSKTRADLLGKNMWEVFPQAADSEAFREIRRAMEEGVTTTFEAISPDLGAWVYGSAYPSPEGVSVYLQDITERKRAEEALQESEELHRLIVEGARDYAIFVIDLEGRIASWPPGARTVFGWTADEIIGQPAAMTFVPEDQASGEPEKELATARDKGMAPDVRWHLRKDGSRVFIDGITRHLRDARGRSRGFLKIGQDVTQRREAEAALRESEERLKAALHAGRMATWDWDPATDQVTASDTLDDLFGLLPGETFRSSAEGLRLVHPDDVDRHRALVEGAAERGESWHSEFRIIRPRDGAVAWLEERATAKRDPRTGTVYMTGIVWDITERKKAEEVLGASEERLQRAIAIETVGVIFFKGDGQITDANDAFLRMGGYNREDLAEGMLRWDLMTPPEWMPRSLQAVEELQKTGRTTPYEKEYIRKDGSRWWGLFAATRLDEEESVEFVVDVSERRKIEEERERLAAHELTARAQTEERRRLSRELHDRVAHDMALVHQSLELHAALKDSDPERAEIKMELAKESVKRALHSTKYLSMELRQPEVRRGLEAALADLLRDLVPPNVRVDLSVDGDEAFLPPETRNQLFVILREAVRNALTHSGCRELALELSISPEEVVGRVEDDGRGFEHKQARRGGGIRSMRERAALLKGTLEISAAPNGGTRVTVSVPLEGRS